MSVLIYLIAGLNSLQKKQFQWFKVAPLSIMRGCACMNIDFGISCHSSLCEKYTKTIRIFKGTVKKCMWILRTLSSFKNKTECCNQDVEIYQWPPCPHPCIFQDCVPLIWSVTHSDYLRRPLKMVLPKCDQYKRIHTKIETYKHTNYKNKINLKALTHNKYNITKSDTSSHKKYTHTHIREPTHIN